jgi:hypothetical protein
MHKFFDRLLLDSNTGTPLAAGPVDPPTEAMYQIWVWISQNQSGAAATGSGKWEEDPVTPSWECTTKLFDSSQPFVRGEAQCMAVALVKKGDSKAFFGWWDDVEILTP